jgi:hypothetical protein
MEHGAENPYPRMVEKVTGFSYGLFVTRLPNPLDGRDDAPKRLAAGNGNSNPTTHRDRKRPDRPLSTHTLEWFDPRYVPMMQYEEFDASEPLLSLS